MTIKTAEELRRLQKDHVSESFLQEITRIEAALNRAIDSGDTYIYYTATKYGYYKKVIEHMRCLGYACEEPTSDQREGHCLKITW
jgi:hypothetical protein